MIFVDRSKSPPPAILLDKTLKSGGLQETERAIAFYKSKGNRNKSFPFKTYSDATVKQALEMLFNGKCAYCESQYMSVMPSEVEHWRPKGEVEGEAKQKFKPGYYWLAADWDNLLPSCIDCNRRRYQKVGLGNGVLVLLGKQNSFPLEAGSPRASKPTEEKNEKPLLLHPCKDKPLEFLAVAVEFDSRGLVCAKTGAPAPNRAKAEASIQVYGLNRAELTLARKRRFIEIQTQITRIEEAVARVKNAPDAASRKRESNVYDREMNLLLSFTDDKAPYSLMAQQIVTHFLAARV